MKIVKQRDRTGCGLACVAMITGQTYWQVRRKVIPDDPSRPYATTAKDLNSLSKNIAPKMISTNSWEKVPNLAIVAVGKRKSGNWHWVVFQRKNDIAVFYDPWTASARTDFGKVHIKAYIPIKMRKW